MKPTALCSYISVLLMMVWPLTAGGQNVTEEWLRSDDNGFPYGSMIAMDSQENVVVTGWRFGSYIVTKKYDPDGTMLWERQFTVADHQAVATWVLVDPLDNVIITGYPRTFSSNPVETGLLTIKYDSEGNLLWSDTYDGTWALAVRGICDGEGNVYVAGRAWFGTYDFVTIKYAPDGTRLWVDTFDQNSGFHTPNSIDLDSEGNLIINGAGISGGFITVRYGTDGVRRWIIEGSGNVTTWISATPDGYFYLTGRSYDVPTGNDIWLLKYDLSGTLIWERTYDFGGTSEYGTRLATDSGGNIVVTGIQGVPTDWITIKTDPDGNLLWSVPHDTHPSWDEYPNFMMIGPEDEIYITGTGGPCPPLGCSYRSMVTLRYDSDGSNPWSATTYATSQLGVGMVRSADNSIYAAGDFMLTVIKYVQTGTVGVGIVSGLPDAAHLSQNYPNPFNPSTVITFSLPRSEEVVLKIFSLIGEEVATLISGRIEAGTHSIRWDATGQPAGVYFYRLNAGDHVETRKLILLK